MQFQSTLPRRERRRKPKQGTNHVNISIHAPAKGATHRIRDLQRKDRFQSTLPRRERHRLHLIKRSDMNFNPRSREGSDVAALAICDANTNFNPRSREGSDGKYLYGIRRQHHFNPRSREGSDDLRQMGQGRPCRFQSTLPRRERLPIGWSHPSWSNFNPRSREGSDKLVFAVTNPSNISIHAPAKGATAVPIGKIIVCIYFNPRSREGSDLEQTKWADLLEISRRERRECRYTRKQSKKYFNPRSREGSDDSGQEIPIYYWEFQSTLPRRERLCPRESFRRWTYFNPRSREGSDAALDSLNRKMEISIHAPAKGATMEYTHSASYRQFQSTLPRRERRELAKVLQTSNISIHAPAKGATISYTVS